MELSTLATKTLEVTVWDYDIGKSNDFIGEGGACRVVPDGGQPGSQPGPDLACLCCSPASSLRVVHLKFSEFPISFFVKTDQVKPYELTVMASCGLT